MTYFPSLSLDWPDRIFWLLGSSFGTFILPLLDKTLSLETEFSYSKHIDFHFIPQLGKTNCKIGDALPVEFGIPFSQEHGSRTRLVSISAGAHGIFPASWGL